MGEPAAWLVKLIDASRWPVCSDSQEPSGGQHARGTSHMGLGAQVEGCVRSGRHVRCAGYSGSSRRRMEMTNPPPYFTRAV
jgi:hypothetical protein